MLHIKKFNIYELVYFTFALDSLLKINLLGFRLHIGVFAIILILGFNILTLQRYSYIKSFLSKNWSILPFFIYIFIHIAFNPSYPGIALTMVYYLLGLAVFYFAFTKEKFISKEAILTFQWIIILTGLLQFILYKLFNYQLTFIDAEHYMLGGSFAVRLRGFFLEPNWYSIVITFNTLLLIMSYKKDIMRFKGLILFTLICILFNGSYTFAGVFALGIVIRFFMDLPEVSKIRLITISFMFLIVASLFISRSYTKSHESSTVINYGSRLKPAIKTINFMSEQPIHRQIFGLGVGSWPYIGLEENKLGYIGMAGEYKIKPAQRDSAEFQVFLLEVGYLGLLLFIFDYIYNYLRFSRLNLIYSLASAAMLASFFIYPIFKFAIYLLPFYLIRARAVKENYKYV